MIWLMILMAATACATASMRTDRQTDRQTEKQWVLMRGVGLMFEMYSRAATAAAVSAVGGERRAGDRGSEMLDVTDEMFALLPLLLLLHDSSTHTRTFSESVTGSHTHTWLLHSLIIPSFLSPHTRSPPLLFILPLLVSL